MIIVQRISCFFMIVFLIFVTMDSYAFVTESSWYSNEETNYNKCADGKYHDLSTELVCASWDFPFQTRLLITRIGGESVEVVVVDRGPAKRLYRKGRKIDISKAAAKRLGFIKDGLAKVVVERIGD